MRSKSKVEEMIGLREYLEFIEELFSWNTGTVENLLHKQSQMLFRMPH